MGLGLSLLTIALCLSLGLGIALRHHHEDEDQDNGLDAIVDLGYTKYNGRKFADGISHWLGMRYAAAPVGILRFAEPHHPPQEDAVQSAVTSGKHCLGTHSKTTEKPIPYIESEDCLFVDVSAPTNATRLPVYVFIQGGGFNQNSGTRDGKDLIKASGMNIVVVTFNYRVSLYGFLASKEVQDDASLNNGLKDQRMLLEWVQKHIEKFGGDPDHVVIGGASAGAASVTLQLVAYGGRDDGLFHATAAESQSFAALRTVSESQYQYDELVARTQCSPEHTGKNNTLACLRGLSIEALDKANINTNFPGGKLLPLFAYNPTLDYDFIEDYTFTLFESGRFVRVPAIYGDDTDEGTVFVPRKVNTAQDFKDWLQSQFPAITPAQLDTLISLYPPAGQSSPNGKYWESTCKAYADIRYICAGMHLNMQYVRRRVHGNFNYRYNVQNAVDIRAGLGVPHVSEVDAIWGNAGSSSYHGSGPNAHVVPLIQAYWTSFIRTFDPNTYRLPDSPAWEEWTADDERRGERRRLLIQGGDEPTEMETVSSEIADRCDRVVQWGVGLKQ